METNKMNKRIYNKNKKAWSNFLTKELWENKVEKADRTNEYKIVFGEKESRLPAIEIEFNHNMMLLTSKYDEEMQIEAWAKQFQNIHYESIICIFGLRDGAHIKRLLEITKPTVNIIVYEPCKELFIELIKNVDISQLAVGRLALIIEGLNDLIWQHYLDGWFLLSRFSFVKYYCAPNYDIIFAKQYEKYQIRLKDFYKRILMNRNTVIAFSDFIPKNVIGNLKHIINSCSIQEITKAIPKGYPAIIISAGPSLELNINELKRAKNKALLIATDTALKPLLNKGIIPDIYVSIDAIKPPRLFDHEKAADIPTLLLEDCNTEIVKMHKGKEFFSIGSSTWCANLLGVFKKSTEYIESGGSVANNAFSLALRIQCDPIIFVGQDLSYPGNKSHIDGTFHDVMTEEMLYQLIPHQSMCEIEDIHGNKVLTSQDLQNYHRWFESKIQEVPEVKVIDATEGGAKIEGTIIKTLRETIDEDCKREYDFEAAIQNIPAMFNRSEMKKVKTIIKEIPFRIERVYKKLNAGIKDYELLIHLVQQESLNREKLKKINDRIKKNNNYLEKDSIANLLRVGIKNAKLGITYQLNQENDNVREEMIALAKNGVLYYEEMKKVLEQCEPLFEKAIKECCEEQEE